MPDIPQYEGLKRFPPLAPKRYPRTKAEIRKAYAAESKPVAASPPKRPGRVSRGKRLSAGDQVGRYTVIKCLGRVSGNNLVYLVHCTACGKELRKRVDHMISKPSHDGCYDFTSGPAPRIGRESTKGGYY